MTNRDDNGASFQAFLEGWLVRQQHYLDELLSVLQHCHESRDEDLKELINRVLAHYQQYYEEKSKIAHRNVFLVFSPTWFTTLERAFLWIAGFKPGLALRVVADSVDDLSEEQRQRMNRLMNETKVEEQALDNELAKIQESVAAPPLLNVVKRRGRLVDGELQGDEAATDALKTAMEAILTGADSLRIMTALKVVEILSPTQTLKFLAAATQLQLKIRDRGLERS
ncbi:protein RESPONSE TO ABA AND SALT 1 isoform X1 [Ziziphus jujuba]|uniref:Protein RESPONSE TO ABA AND SALT 1 isoform X1 n=1 Tax=Ziziphus jujuba TaxID=326968 RepID=A0A6P4AID1_ZIZJJ|nr:protein RESPONSE TO ABA AND SALT 1 isoform X1 [Ziziphus jujuba]